MLDGARDCSQDLCMLGKYCTAGVDCQPLIKEILNKRIRFCILWDEHCLLKVVSLIELMVQRIMELEHSVDRKVGLLGIKLSRLLGWVGAERREGCRKGKQIL